MISGLSVMLKCSCLRLALKSTLTRDKVFPQPERTAVTWTPKGLQIRLHVKPNSMADRILNLRKDGLDVAVTAVARDDKANRGVMDLISKVLDIKKDATTIVAGQKTRQKVLLVCLAQHPSSKDDQHKHMEQIIRKLKQAVAR